MSKIIEHKIYFIVKLIQIIISKVMLKMWELARIYKETNRNLLEIKKHPKVFKMLV